MSWREVIEEERCPCGARFRRAGFWNATGSTHDNEAWEEIGRRALSLVPKRGRELYQTLLDIGVYVEDLFDGVAYLGRVFGVPTYALRGVLRPKPKEEVARRPTNALRIFLWESGFSPRLCRLCHARLDWWEGSIGDVRVEVCPSHPGCGGGVAVSIEVKDVPLRGKWLELPDEEQDGLYEAWAWWLLDNGEEGEYEVTDCLDLSDHETSEGFVWRPTAEAGLPLTGEDWEAVLRRGLEVYEEKVRRFLSEFFESRGKERAFQMELSPGESEGEPGFRAPIPRHRTEKPS
ncbi:hypothetical protein DXX99_08655 [Ammonifex thiophilus]|uniref:Uncharacterized protein n=1 Tax=Ammonifex thiophilus TaxID=444093 RepID=A0A3D8P490_9THEO|nr:hypothetical protein DXX99_08655 [Ammonifex thiophilus]